MHPIILIKLVLEILLFHSFKNLKFITPGHLFIWETATHEAFLCKTAEEKECPLICECLISCVLGFWVLKRRARNAMGLSYSRGTAFLNRVLWESCHCTSTVCLRLSSPPSLFFFVGTENSHSQIPAFHGKRLMSLM